MKTQTVWEFEDPDLITYGVIYEEPLYLKKEYGSLERAEEALQKLRENTRYPERYSVVEISRPTRIRKIKDRNE